MMIDYFWLNSISIIPKTDTRPTIGCSQCLVARSIAGATNGLTSARRLPKSPLIRTA